MGTQLTTSCTFADMQTVATNTVIPVYTQLQQLGIPQGGSGGLTTFYSNMWNNYKNSGCSWWSNRVSHWQYQLPSISNPYHAQLKLAKIAFGQQMHTVCGCSGSVPLTSSGTYIINIAPLLPVLTNNGILDNSSVFPPISNYKIIIAPNPGETIQAAQYAVKNMLLSYKEDINSKTNSPSRFQWIMNGLGDEDKETTSGLKEFSTFYKVVFEDSTNPDNDTNWNISDFSGENLVNMWVYLGKNETTPINSSSSLYATIDIEYNSTLIAEEETINETLITKNITSFKF